MEIAFALDTFYAVMAGGFVIFMGAGFYLIEGGSLEKKNWSENFSKKIRL